MTAQLTLPPAVNALISSFSPYHWCPAIGVLLFQIKLNFQLFYPGKKYIQQTHLKISLKYHVFWPVILNIKQLIINSTTQPTHSIYYVSKADFNILQNFPLS